MSLPKDLLFSRSKKGERDLVFTLVSDKPGPLRLPANFPFQQVTYTLGAYLVPI